MARSRRRHRPTLSCSENPRSDPGRASFNRAARQQCLQSRLLPPAPHQQNQEILDFRRGQVSCHLHHSVAPQLRQCNPHWAPTGTKFKSSRGCRTQLHGSSLDVTGARVSLPSCGGFTGCLYRDALNLKSSPSPTSAYTALLLPTYHPSSACVHHFGPVCAPAPGRHSTSASLPLGPLATANAPSQ